jgi:hypothetical protein
MSLQSEFSKSKKSLDFTTSISPYVEAQDKDTLVDMYMSLLRSHLELNNTLEELVLLFTGLKPCEYSSLTVEEAAKIQSKFSNCTD